MIVTACGSAKYKPLIHEICNKLSGNGLIVLTPPLHDMSFTRNIPDDGALLAWKGATHAHFQRIAKSSLCLMVNPGGYLGVSSTLELGYAVALSKYIVALQHDPEPAREGLFDKVLETENVEVVVNMVVKLSRSIWRNDVR